VADRNFTRAAAAGDLSEVELGQLADHNGRSPEARQFGQRMINDHSKANDQLKAIAAAVNIPLPNAPGPEDQAMRERLDKLRGEAFDGDYIRGQISAHQETVQLFEYEMGSGQDSQLKNFAVQTLPVLMEHLEMAQNINARLTGALER
jgi:putative membrane protein